MHECDIEILLHHFHWDLAVECLTKHSLLLASVLFAIYPLAAKSQTSHIQPPDEFTNRLQL